MICKSNSYELSIVFGFVQTIHLLLFINIDPVFLSIQLRWSRFRIRKSIKIMKQKQTEGMSIAEAKSSIYDASLEQKVDVILTAHHTKKFIEYQGESNSCTKP